MALPYPMPPVSPFDVITSQAENEKIANIEAIYNGELAPSSLAADKIDFTTFINVYGNTSAIPITNTITNIASYTVVESGRYTVEAIVPFNNNAQGLRDILVGVRVGTSAHLAETPVTTVSGSYFDTISVMYVGNFTTGQVIGIAISGNPGTGVVSDSRGQYKISKI